MDVDQQRKYNRTPEEVSDVLKVASIDEMELTKISQVLYPKSNDTKGPVTLLELNKDLMEAIEKGEDCLSFRGRMDDFTMLCTKNRTYEIKIAETSNSLLLVPNLKFHRHTKGCDNRERVVEHLEVQGVFHKYFEVRETVSYLNRLTDILEPSAFKGLEYEKSIDSSTLYDWERLRNEMQASDEELLQALPRYLVTEINGYYRLISFEHEARTMVLMLDLIDENSWDLDEIDKEETYEALKELTYKSVFEVLFEKYAEPTGKTNKEGNPLYRYKEIMVCKFLAKVLLAASPKNEYNHFMEAWRVGTPEKMEPKEEYLHGIALIISDNSKCRKEVVSFPESNLPTNVTQRLNELFKVKEKWTIEEITPYVINLTTSNMDVNALLTKFARCCTVNGVKHFVSKHGY